MRFNIRDVCISPPSPQLRKRISGENSIWDTGNAFFLNVFIFFSQKLKLDMKIPLLYNLKINLNSDSIN